ncbi:DUF6415 family natural product biosynthesis protein [Streptomyces bobili]|uniref:DUF6415 family natural product biosynthesis protein n=1 Tax=Streptomyces bobili TaxID=67280 RepID=UPI0036F5FA30
MLSKLRTWQAFDGDALLDDVATALDDVPPAEQDVEEVAQRLRGHLMRLVNIAIAAEAERDDVAGYLIERARALRVEELPGDHRKAVGYLRRMGWIVNEFLERLVAMRCLKGTA